MQNLDVLAWKLAKLWRFWCPSSCSSSSSLWWSWSSLSSSSLAAPFRYYLELLPCKIWTFYLKNCPSYGHFNLHIMFIIIIIIQGFSQDFLVTTDFIFLIFFFEKIAKMYQTPLKMQNSSDLGHFQMKFVDLKKKN